MLFFKEGHNIIQSHKNVTHDWQYYAEYLEPLRLNVGNITHNNVSPIEHSYGYEYCY